MKKLIYGTLFLAIIGIGFTSCEKEEIVNSTKDKIVKEVYLPLITLKS